jgi:hypothetical protein
LACGDYTLSKPGPAWPVFGVNPTQRKIAQDELLDRQVVIKFLAAEV